MKKSVIFDLSYKYVHGETIILILHKITETATSTELSVKNKF